MCYCLDYEAQAVPRKDVREAVSLLDHSLMIMGVNKNAFTVRRIYSGRECISVHIRVAPHILID